MLTTLPDLQAPPTEAEAIRTEIARLTSWLDVPSVIACGHWVDEINTKLGRLRGDLAQAERPATYRR